MPDRRLLPPLFYGSSAVLQSLRWRLPPSLITTESICRWFFPFYPLFLCSSLSVPALSVCCGGVLIFHPTSNHHIDRLMGRPVGGRLEHAALAVVLFQAADELTTFIFLRMIKTSCKKKKKNQLSGLWIQQTRPQSSSIIVPEYIINSDVLLGLRPHLFDFHHWRVWKLKTDLTFTFPYQL